MKRRVRTIIEFLGYKNKEFVESPFVATKLTSLGPIRYPIMINCWRLVSFDNQHFMQINFQINGYFANEKEIDPLLTFHRVRANKNLTAIAWATDTLLRVNFSLLSGKGFTESGLEVLFEVLLAFGVERSVAKEYLRGFHILQETEIKWRGQWMGYEQYLRLTLPVLLEK